MQNRSSNQQIARNTLYLYLRMAIIMVFQLYTSRIILIALGISDYGIYNVIGGIVVMFGFLNGALTGSTQRYITYELGSGDSNKLRSVFSSSIQLHLLIAVVVAIIAEPVGYWLIYYEMQIPEDRLLSAFIVFQISIANFAVSVVSVPYLASIIAHEKMSIFAYMSICDVISRLIVCYLLLLCDNYRLVLFSMLIFVISSGVFIFYKFYCNHHYKETIYHHKVDRTLLKEMISFSGWNLFGHIANVLNAQGMNILLNIFFGPVVNAARGIAVQVQTAIYGFCNNFQTAVNPELTKSYAAGEHDRAIYLMKVTSKYSFYLLFLITLPLFLEIDPLLSLWLKEVPTDTSLFIRLLLLLQLFYTLTLPMSTVLYAAGDIKKLSIVCGIIMLTILPISWIVLKCGAPAYSVFVVHNILEFVSMIVRLLIISNIINFSIRDFIYDVYFRVIIVGGISFLLTGSLYLSLPNNFISVVIVCIVSMLTVSVIALYMGMSLNERRFVLSFISSYIHKVVHKLEK